MLNTIGSRIRARRVSLGLSVDELAQKLGKNRATVYRYESDEIENFPISVIAPLAQALDVSPSYLMGWENNVSNDSSYSIIFKANLINILETLDMSSFAGSEAAEADFAFLRRLSESDDSIRLEDACRAADLLGIGLDSLLLIKSSATDDDDGRAKSIDDEIIALISRLSPEKLKEAMSYLHYLSERGE